MADLKATESVQACDAVFGVALCIVAVPRTAAGLEAPYRARCVSDKLRNSVLLPESAYLP